MRCSARVEAPHAFRGRPVARSAARLRAVPRRQAAQCATATDGGREVSAVPESVLRRIEVPEILIQIRAFVRWEEAGKPEDMPPEWQAAEYKLAIEDLQRELASGVSLNTIRRRYNQPTVDGDDEPMDLSWLTAEPVLDTANLDEPSPQQQQQQAASSSAVVQAPPPAQTFTDGSIFRRFGDLRAVLGTEAGALEAETELSPGATLLARWAREPRNSRGRKVSQRIYSLGGLGELLVELVTHSEVDATAQSAPRDVVTSREVILTTDALDPLVLHWGVARDEPGQWTLPPESVMPIGSVPVSEIACETMFEETEGCFEATTDDVMQECYPLQRLRMELPGEGADELMGLQFVVRTENGEQWFKDESNFNSNFIASFTAPAADELTERIIRAEAGGNWWSLMHRFNLCRSLLEGALASKDKGTTEKVAKLFVWLRYSSTRKLTWQRNYNIKPRELSSAQSALTKFIAKAYVDNPAQKDLLRLMLSTLGRGGEGGDGQQIRDEILNIMHRNNIKEVKGIWMEEWHQKLHNNTTPDDIVICEAYLAFLRSNMDLSEYWRVLDAGGITRERLASYERPIKAEPTPRPHIKDALIRDFENYLNILRRVHSGADLELASNYAGKFLDSELKGVLDFVKARQNDQNVVSLVEACVEARGGVVTSLSHTGDADCARDLLFLDLALDDLVRRAVERAAMLSLDTTQQMDLVGLVMENVALSSLSSNEELVYCALEWRRICACRRDGDDDWPLRAKAVVDRVRLNLSLVSDTYSRLMQETAEAIGRACAVDEWAIDVFSEEVIRGGPAFALSILLSRLDPLLRAAADMGSWQVISPVPAVGYVKVVDDLNDWQSTTFDRPTVLIAASVGGDEEIPAGATAVLTGSTVDVLSHSAVRARNMGVCFGTCYEPAILDSLTAVEGRIVNIDVANAGEIVFSVVDSLETGGSAASSSTGVGNTGSTGANNGGMALSNVTFGGEYVIPLSQFREGVVGAKALNTRLLHDSLRAGGLPEWIGLPPSVALPFGTFETLLKLPLNKLARDDLALAEAAIDTSTAASTQATLKACRAAARTVVCPNDLRDALLAALKVSSIAPVPADEALFERAWGAITGVWASKWNDRAYISTRNVGIDHTGLRMSVLCQPIIPAEYAFVIHTTNPSTEDPDEIYAELVCGLGETLVGNYPGRALAFTCNKAPGATPQVKGYPSKSIGLFTDETLIFRSDSNGEDLEGYAGAGLYESIPMIEPAARFIDYNAKPIVWDKETQIALLRGIADVAIAVEQACNGVPQDIEGVIRADGAVFVVQTRPQC